MAVFFFNSNKSKDFDEIFWLLLVAIKEQIIPLQTDFFLNLFYLAYMVLFSFE